MNKQDIQKRIHELEIEVSVLDQMQGSTKVLLN